MREAEQIIKKSKVCINCKHITKSRYTGNTRYKEPCINTPTASFKKHVFKYVRVKQYKILNKAVIMKPW